MFTDITYQDWEASDDRIALGIRAAERYRSSAEFRLALEARDYFRGDNVRVRGKTVLRAFKAERRDENGRRRVRAETRDVVGNRIGSGFLFRFVTQQNQYLLSEGCILPRGVKERLGPDFDHLLSRMGECALLQGVCWGWWNADHLEALEAAADSRSGFVALRDEMTGEPRVGLQFWQLDSRRPMYLRVFEEDGVSQWRCGEGGPVCVMPRRPYLLRGDGEAQPGWGRLPLIPLYANPEGASELTPSIRAKIDAYDAILSDFADNLERANDVYWVLNNFGGTLDDVAVLLEEISRVKAVANLSDGSGGGATAEPRTIEVPYAARKCALEILERALYADWMALDMDQVTGGSLTNVAIRAATAALDLKADRYEWQLIRFVRALLSLLGIGTAEIRFRRQCIANESETVQDIAAMRGDIDRRTALKLNPYIQEEEIDRLC